MGCVNSTPDKTPSTRHSQRSHRNQRSLLLLGIDGSGSTTILYQLTMKRFVETIPTLGCNQESFVFDNVEYDLWDLGGLDKLRPLWRQYSREADATVYVVDASDRTRATAAAEALRTFFGDGVNSNFHIPNRPLLVFANKQDIENHMSLEEIEEVLGLKALPLKSYKIVPCCAKTGENLNVGLEWITSELRKA